MRFPSALNPDPEVWKSGLRTAAAGGLAYICAEILALPQGYWAVMTAIVIMQASIGASLAAAADRFLGTLAGAALGLVLASVTPSTELGTIVALMLSTGMLGMLAARVPSFRIAPVTAAILLAAAPSHADAFISALHRVVEITIGCGIGVAVALIVVPSRADSRLRAEASRTLALLAKLITIEVEGPHGSTADQALAAVSEDIYAAYRNIDTLTKEVQNRHERDFVEVWARFGAVTIVHGLAGRGREYRHVQRMQAWSLPLFVFFAVTTWFLLVLLSFTCILWALRTEPSWARALSSSGSALSTLGFLTPSTLFGEYLAIFEAAIGLAIVILLFTFVPGYLAAIQVRERKVGWLYARTGRHPNCLSLLEALNTSGRLNNPGVWEDWEHWFRGVLETHSIAPILAYVPSVYSGTSWVSASAAVLDTTSLLLATLESQQTDAARICRETGVTLVRLIARELHRHRAIEDRPSSHLDADAIKIFDQLYDKLHELDLPIKTNREECRERFVTLRAEYESNLRHIARSTLMPIEELGIHASHDTSVAASHTDKID